MDVSLTLSNRLRRECAASKKSLEPSAKYQVAESCTSKDNTVFLLTKAFLPCFILLVLIKAHKTSNKFMALSDCCGYTTQPTYHNSSATLWLSVVLQHINTKLLLFRLRSTQ